MTNGVTNFKTNIGMGIIRSSSHSEQTNQTLESRFRRDGLASRFRKVGRRQGLYVTRHRSALAGFFIAGNRTLLNNKFKDELDKEVKKRTVTV
jgi:hypothetical protein